MADAKKDRRPLLDRMRSYQREPKAEALLAEAADKIELLQKIDATASHLVHLILADANDEIIEATIGAFYDHQRKKEQGRG